MFPWPRSAAVAVATVALGLCALPVAAAVAPPVFPGDPGFTSQWGLHQPDTDPFEPSRSDHDIDAPEAWALVAGRSPAPVTVGVLEGEIELAHPDLAGRLWVNRGEIAGNGVDDDRNGYVDDVHGSSGEGGGAVSRRGPGADHGTAVAGVIAARHDNGIALAGVAPNARIMALTSWPMAAGLHESLRYAADNGARVVNISLGSPGTPVSMAGSAACAAIAEMSDRTLVVVAAGNDGTDNDVSPVHPAGCPATGLVVAMSASAAPRLAPWSNHGRLSVDLAAPGESVPVLCSSDCALGSPSGDYRFDTGTSYAAPHVAGAAALLFGLHPEATPAQVRAAILAGATPLVTPEGERERPIAGGHLNLAGAIAALDAMLPPQDPGAVGPGPIPPPSPPPPPAPAASPAGPAGAQGARPVVRRPALTRARALAAIRRSRALARPLRALIVSRRAISGIRRRDMRLIDVTGDGRRDAIARVRAAGRPAGWIVVSDHFGAARVVFSTRARLGVRVRRGRLETVRRRSAARPRIVRYAPRSGRLMPIR